MFLGSRYFYYICTQKSALSFTVSPSGHMDYQYHIFSPYRVCPLGAHVDHQHGLVTGFAIDKGVDLWFNVREDSVVKLSSRTFEGNVEFHVNTPSQVKGHHWGDYARGAKYALRKRFELNRGRFDIGSLDTYYQAIELYGTN